MAGNLGQILIFGYAVLVAIACALLRLKGADRSKQQALWESLGHELNTWAHLYATEQAFLVEVGTLLLFSLAVTKFMELCYSSGECIAQGLSFVFDFSSWNTNIYLCK